MVATAVENRSKKIFSNFDIDSDGAITRQDFDQMAQRLINSLSIQPDSTQGRKVMTSYTQVWDELARQSDSDGDGSVSAEEYAAAFDSPDFVKVLDQASDAEFDAADTDGDGVLSSSELRGMLKAYGVMASEVDTAAQALDRDGDGQVSREEYRAAWHDYYTNGGDSPFSQALGRI